MAPVHLESKLSQKLAAHFHICAFGIFSCNQVFQPLVRKVFCVLLSDGQVQLQRETERLRKKSLLYSRVLETEGTAWYAGSGVKHQTGQ